MSDNQERRPSIGSLPTGSEGRGVLGVGSIPVTILLSCQDMKTIALYNFFIYRKIFPPYSNGNQINPV